MQQKMNLWILVLLVSLVAWVAAAEGRLGGIAGGGVLEFLHGGFRYVDQHWGIGGYGGGLPGSSSSQSTWTIGVDGYYFFHDGTPAGRSRPWYVRVGGQYLSDRTSTVDDRYWMLTVRLGKQFDVTEQFSWWVDAGAQVKLSRNRSVSADITNIQPGLNISLPVFPAASVGIVYWF